MDQTNACGVASEGGSPEGYLLRVVMQAENSCVAFFFLQHEGMDLRHGIGRHRHTAFALTSAMSWGGWFYGGNMLPYEASSCTIETDIKPSGWTDLTKPSLDRAST